MIIQQQGQENLMGQVCSAEQAKPSAELVLQQPHNQQSKWTLTVKHANSVESSTSGSGHPSEISCDKIMKFYAQQIGNPKCIKELCNVSLSSSHNISILKSEEKAQLHKTQEGVYYGQWLKGKPHGIGALYTKKEVYIFGQFLNGKANGWALLIYPNGGRYQGSVVNNLSDGKGVYILEKQGFRYQGNWYDGNPSGIGKATYKNGLMYTGEFLNGRKHGKGSLSCGGDYYQGTFLDDKFEGYGKYSTHNGQIYRGNWHNNQKNGYGSYEWPNGDHFEGNYKNGEREGEGIFYYRNGQRYCGGWKKGLKHGRGRIDSADGTIQGIWKEGQLITKL